MIAAGWLACPDISPKVPGNLPVLREEATRPRAPRVEETEAPAVNGFDATPLLCLVAVRRL